MNIKKIIKDYYSISLLKEEDFNNLSSFFNEESIIYTPIDGKIEGKESIVKYLINLKNWLNTTNAKIDIINTIESDFRLIIEFLVFIELDEGEEPVELPVVIVIDFEDNLVRNIRIYHSTWPLTGEHIIIKPILKPINNLEKPEVISEYMKAIKKADIEKVLSLFEEDAYVQEPSGSLFRHQGKNRRREFYSFALDKGGIPLKHCTATFDGKSYAIEYVFDKWGDIKFEAQAGIAVYEIGKSGKISAVRIYDDATPPT
jgi:ketosteroid isomerase-like protein